MSPILVGIIIGVILILAGLAMCRWCDSAGARMSGIVYIAGIVLLILGLLIVFFPVLEFLYRMLMEAFGIQRARL